MTEIQSTIVDMPANAGSMLRNPKTVYANGDTVYCIATDGKFWKCHRRQKGSEGYPIIYEMTDKMVNYHEFLALAQKEDSIHVTTQMMDEDGWAPRQDLDLMPPHVIKNVIEFLIENKSYVKSEGDARALMTTMSREELLDCYLQWNGISGFTHHIIAAVNGINHAKQGF